MSVTCLIAEDSPPVIHLLRTYATMCGYEPTFATVGERVLELVQQEIPAIIVLNVELPGRVRGWEVLRALKANQEMRHIPIVVFWLNPDGRNQHSACDADVSVPIPMNYHAFRTALEAALHGPEDAPRGAL